MEPFDVDTDNAKRTLAEAEEKYKNAIVSMANVSAIPRKIVLDLYRRDIDEARQKIEAIKKAAPGNHCPV
jgi:hypothetical protein